MSKFTYVFDRLRDWCGNNINDVVSLNIELCIFGNSKKKSENNLNEQKTPPKNTVQFVWKMKNKYQQSKA